MVTIASYNIVTIVHIMSELSMYTQSALCYTIIVNKRYTKHQTRKGVTTMIIRDAKGITAEVHLYDNTGIDFVEEYLNAGSLARDADGVYTVDDDDLGL